MTQTLEKIVGTAFEAQTVELDGKHFEDCTFDDCTLILRTRSAFETINCTFMPGCRIECPAYPLGMSELLWQQIWASAASNGESNGLGDH